MGDDHGVDASEHLGFAPIEDLDPEPRARGARSVWLEWILGLLLVGALVGFGGWQWWEQGTRLGHYQAGQGAAAAHDWPAARTAYLAAGTYADAAARAAEAASLIAEHTRQAQRAT